MCKRGHELADKLANAYSQLLRKKNLCRLIYCGIINTCEKPSLTRGNPRVIRPKGGYTSMATTKYEILYIIRPNIDEDAKTALVERFDTILTENGATISESKDWEKRRLAYEINNFREGLYRIVTLEADSESAATSEFDRLSKINDDILRHMITKVEA